MILLMMMTMIMSGNEANEKQWRKSHDIKQWNDNGNEKTMA